MTALARARAGIEREIVKHTRHIQEGTSIGGESAEWHEVARSALAGALAIIDVEAREEPTPEGTLAEVRAKLTGIMTGATMGKSPTVLLAEVFNVVEFIDKQGAS